MSEEGANPNEIKRVSVERNLCWIVARIYWNGAERRRAEIHSFTQYVAGGDLGARESGLQVPQHSPVSTWQIQNALDGQRIFLCGLKRERCTQVLTGRTRSSNSPQEDSRTSDHSER